MSARSLVSGLVIAVSILSAAALSANEIRFGDDGWYRWEVPAGNGGQKSCCYAFDNGNVVRKGCRLGHGMDEFSIAEPCAEFSDTMQIFVEVRSGEVREIRPLSSACPVKADEAITTLDDVSAHQSIAWLQQQIGHNPRTADEAVMTLSFHEKEVALQSLFELLADRNQAQGAREQALFWLIQSDYEEAFTYLDRLLD